jgi:hypothetical protein
MLEGKITGKLRNGLLDDGSVIATDSSLTAKAYNN